MKECGSSGRKMKHAVLTENGVDIEDGGKEKTKQNEMKGKEKVPEKNNTRITSHRNGIEERKIMM